MRRRLLLVLVGTVLLALALAAVTTFVGIRTDERRTTQSNLVDYAQRLGASGRALRATDLQSVGRALSLETASVLRFTDPSAEPTAETSKTGLTAAEIATQSDGTQLQAGGVPLDVTDRVLPDDLRSLAAGGSVRGIIGSRVYAAVRLSRSGDAVQVLLLTKILGNTATQAVHTIARASVVALVLAIIAAWVLAQWISRPIARTTEAYARIASGDLSVRVAVGSYADRDDEVGDLMRSLDRMAEALERAKRQERQFLLSVSHDLRTPLTSIRGFAEAIAEGTATDQERAATVISAEARRLERLVQDLLELGKLQARTFTLTPRPTDITDLVTDAADGFLPTAQREHLDLALDADDGLVAVVDPERLAQVLANLIENALKFARTRVHVGATSQGDRIVISVADDGPGIAAEDLAHVFDRHYTTDRRVTRAIGSGLGLAIVRELAEAMGAEVQPTTSPEGTTFIVRLPAAGPLPDARR